MVQGVRQTQNKAITMPFKKGQSGNPGGRPKMPDDLKKAMQGMAAEALELPPS